MGVIRGMAAVVLAAVAVGCSSDDDDASSSSTTTTTVNEWEVGTPADEGMDAEVLDGPANTPLRRG